MRFGKYQGMDIRDVPTEYLDFLIASAETTIKDCSVELDRRAVVEQADQSWAQQVITAGFRQLAKKVHPDVSGGSVEDMQHLNAAVEMLRDAARDKL